MARTCQLYLRLDIGALPEWRELERIARQVEPAALLVTGIAGGAASEALRDFLAAAKRLNLAVLIENDVPLAKELDADGVHLRADSQALAEARKLLGDTKSIGMSCVLSRHEAMTMAEEGADYVAFGEHGLGNQDPDPAETADMLGWWSELFEIPCVAWAREGYGTDDLRELVETGADYLAVADGGRRDEARADWFHHVAALARSPGRADGAE